MLVECIKKLMHGESLTSEQCAAALNEILQGADQRQVAAFLVLLHAKGETAQEVIGLVHAMQQQMLPLPVDIEAIDIVGTGGDGMHTVNISTAASLLAAACGVKVVKHGNRSVSSKCGSADALEAFGIALDMPPEKIITGLHEIGIGFCFAPQFHPAMKALKEVRAALGVRTTFNLLGPLLNPAKVKHILLGVFSPDYLDLLADVLMGLGVKHAFVVHGSGLDELNTLGPVDVIEIKYDEKSAFQLDPKQYGFEYGTLEELQGGDAADNIKILQEVFSGKKGALADTIALNAGAALYVADKVGTIEEGIVIAQAQLQQGAVLNLLQSWQQI